MGVQRDEDFITEFVFVKLYNRSETFRELIRKKFGSEISKEIEFSGSRNKQNPIFGCPDAVGKDGKLYIEVKTRLSTPLTEFEKKSGALYLKVGEEYKRAAKCSSSERRGNRIKDYYGYNKYLKTDTDNKLLYLVCNNNYDLSEACPKQKGRVVYMYWTEILDFLEKNNSDDSFIEIIKNRVEGLEEENKISEITITNRLLKISASLVKKGIIDAANNSIGAYWEEEIIEGPAVWFGWPESFINFENIALGISIETGDAYLCEWESKYNLSPEKFMKKRIEVVSDNNIDKERWIKIFNIKEFNDEDFEENGRLVCEFIKYLNNLGK